VVIALTPLVHAGMAWDQWLREGVGTLMAVLFAAVVTELLKRAQRARGELAEAHEHLRDYTEQAERLATAQERNRVARDIHDGLGHSLTVVQMQVKAARAVLPTDSATADAVLAKAQQQAETALGEVRRSVSALREPRATPPLPEALHALADEASAAGVPTRLAVTGVRRPLPDQVREALYRAAQEGLTNVRKHANATRADLVLHYTDAGVSVEVRDDGTGSVAGPSPGYGLLGLRERAAHLGGRLHLESAPAKGCKLTMEIPQAGGHESSAPSGMDGRGEGER
jgi:signal transduction histidine kinase